MSIRHGPDPRPGDLDPLEEPERWEGLIRQIGARAAPHLARPRESPGILDVVAGWARPALATAASLLLLAAVGGLMFGGADPDPADLEVTLVRAVVPSTFAAWITGTSQPSVTELVVDLETLDEVER